MAWLEIARIVALTVGVVVVWFGGWIFAFMVIARVAVRIVARERLRWRLAFAAGVGQLGALGVLALVWYTVVMFGGNALSSSQATAPSSSAPLLLLALAGSLVVYYASAVGVFWIVCERGARRAAKLALVATGCVAFLLGEFWVVHGIAAAWFRTP